MPQVLVFVLFFAGVYFVLLRPQQQRVKRQRELITAIGVGDRVVTAGGLIGRVIDLADDRLQLEVADGVVVELLRLAISRRLDESEADSAFGTGDTDDEDEYHNDEYEADDSEVAADDMAAPGAMGEPEAPAGPSVTPVRDPGPNLADSAHSPAAAPRPSPAAGSGGMNEEAATPAPRQDSN